MRVACLFTIFYLLTCPGIKAQAFFNSVPVDTLRYRNIKGTPYMYPTWQTARIVGRDSTVYANVLLNYNAYNRSFDVKLAHRIVTLDNSLYDLITIYEDGAEKEWFIKGVHYDIANQLANVIYNGDKIKLIRSYNVKLAEIIDDLPGETLVRKKFYPVVSYFILYKSKLRQIRLTKGRLAKVLEDKELVNKLAAQHHLEVGKETDAIALLRYFEESKPR